MFFFNLAIYNDNETYDSGSEPVNDLSCDIKTIPAPTGAVTRRGDGSVHGVIGGFFNLAIYNDIETYDSGSEPMNDLSCDIKTIPAPTGAVTRRGDGSVNGVIGVFFNLAIYNDIETYDSGSEPMNDLSCNIKTIPTPTFMHTEITLCNHCCALDGAVARQGGSSFHCAIDG